MATYRTWVTGDRSAISDGSSPLRGSGGGIGGSGRGAGGTADETSVPVSGTRVIEVPPRRTGVGGRAGPDSRAGSGLRQKGRPKRSRRLAEEGLDRRHPTRQVDS